MTASDVTDRIAAIAIEARQRGLDSHEMEDALHQDVLRAIAEGRCDDPAECARLALTTADLKFERWYA